nr:nucleoside 2-deoxyribosyltransferase [Acetobacter okinawensis]
MVVSRVDEQIFHKEGIIERIYNQIDTADFIIADMTGMNPNVFYEVGYAHAKGKLCVLITNNAHDIPFDLRHHRHIIYGSSIASLKSKLKIDLAALSVELDARENPVSVELASIYGDLIKTKYIATGEVSLKIDLNNKTNFYSPDIDAIYFYTGKGWSFTQDGQECAQTSASLHDYTHRHMIRSPVSRLPANGWAQVKLVGKKILGATWDGSELQNSYKLVGRVLVRVVTARDNYDYTLNLDVSIDDMPF